MGRRLCGFMARPMGHAQSRPIASILDLSRALPPGGGAERGVTVTGYPRAKFFADELENAVRLGISPRRSKAVRMWRNGRRPRLKIL